MIVKTYEEFNIRNIFKKTFKKDNRKEFVECIIELANNYIEDCRIKVNDESIYTTKNYKWSTITKQFWCSISFDKKLNTYKPSRENKESAGDICIWFNLDFDVNDFIISVIEKYSKIRRVKIGDIISAYNIKNDDIPEIANQLTIENCEEFLITKKYNL